MTLLLNHLLFSVLNLHLRYFLSHYLFFLTYFEVETTAKHVLLLHSAA